MVEGAISKLVFVYLHVRRKLLDRAECFMANLARTIGPNRCSRHHRNVLLRVVVIIVVVLLLMVVMIIVRRCPRT